MSRGWTKQYCLQITSSMCFETSECAGWCTQGRWQIIADTGSRDCKTAWHIKLSFSFIYVYTTNRLKTGIIYFRLLCPPVRYRYLYWTKTFTVVTQKRYGYHWREETARAARSLIFLCYCDCEYCSIIGHFKYYASYATGCIFFIAFVLSSVYIWPSNLMFL